eukprot:scaffold2058_cov115-Cylindrotheca_fusiformis.AAC.2
MKELFIFKSPIGSKKNATMATSNHNSYKKSKKNMVSTPVASCNDIQQEEVANNNNMAKQSHHGQGGNAEGNNGYCNFERTS